MAIPFGTFPYITKIILDEIILNGVEHTGEAIKKIKEPVREYEYYPFWKTQLLNLSPIIVIAVGIILIILIN